MIFLPGGLFVGMSGASALFAVTDVCLLSINKLPGLLRR